MSIFEYYRTDSLPIFARTTQNYSQINYSKLLKKYSIFRTMHCCSLRLCNFEISVMQWRPEVILSTVQYNEYSHGFRIAINRKFRES